LVDIDNVIFEAVDRQPGAMALNFHKPVWSFAQQEDQQEWQRLEAWRPGEVAQPISKSADRKVCVCVVSAGLCCCCMARISCIRQDKSCHSCFVTDYNSSPSCVVLRTLQAQVCE
jgi:hypothetical protein